MRLEFLENGPIRVEGKRFVVRVGEKEEATRMGNTIPVPPWGLRVDWP